METFRNLFAPDVAVDLGTANTIVFAKDQGIMLSEPSVVAVAFCACKTGPREIRRGKSISEVLKRTPSGLLIGLGPIESDACVLGGRRGGRCQPSPPI
jgi:rod shape-determining protein MreB